MFSQACVKNSVHGVGGCGCVSQHALGHTPPVHAGTHTHPHPAQCMLACTLPGQTPPPGRHTHISLGQIPPPPDGHCSKWYASYWNAFLFLIQFSTVFVVCLFVCGNLEHLQTASSSVNICLLVFLQSEEFDDLKHEQISQTLASEISPLEEMANFYKSDAQDCPNEFQQSLLDLTTAISVNIRQ